MAVSDMPAPALVDQTMIAADSFIAAVSHSSQQEDLIMSLRYRSADPVTLLAPPYRFFLPARAGEQKPPSGGSIMTWNLGVVDWRAATETVVNRSAGVPLAIVLPNNDHASPITPILRAIERARPQAVLPYHEALCPREVTCVIRRPPASLATSIAEYLLWRGFAVDPVARNIIRRTIELSPHVQTITALAKNLRMSRRAMGRRMLDNSLPVPSHWLSIARILHATIKLQNSDASLFSVACSLGYPDGFSLSNQMSRLCGIRPLETRKKFGWEWVFETWLVQESERGSVASAFIDARPSIAAPNEVGTRKQRAGPPLEVSG